MDRKRRRELTCWSIREYSDREGSWFRVSGIVVTGDSEQPMAPDTNIRLTTSGPILKSSGQVLETKNTIYYLDDNPSFLWIKSAWCRDWRYPLETKN